MATLKTLYKRINYTFKDETLIQQALTHRSAGPKNNERLEFLGDSVVNFVVAAELFKRFPKAQEGDLSRRRANLVRRETLAELAQEINLGEFLKLGVCEQRSGGAQRTSILADAIEGIIGAMFLDSDSLDICYDHIQAWYETRLQVIAHTKVVKDPKSRLQEYIQSKGFNLPKYSIEKVKGAAHQQTFKISCQVDALSNPVYGEGSSRQRAEQAAAASALEQLNQ